MRLVVGLGNPGKKYEKTRHNIGYRVIDLLKKKIGINTQGVLLFKPQTFMNLSGQEVSKKLNRLGASSENLIVIYDDIDLPLGKVRIRHKGSSGGHKGVQSIIDTLQTENFTRVRIGVGRPPKDVSAQEYVLEKLEPAKEETIQKAIDEAAEIVIRLLRKE